jgi:fructokinase
MNMERFKNKFLTIEECKTLLYSYPAKVICFTCGKEGVWFKEEGKPWQFKDALSVTNVVDVTGAGDAFWATLILSI